MNRLFVFLIIFFQLSTCSAASLAKKSVKAGNLLYNKGEFSEALKNYEQAFTDAPESEIVNYNLGAGLYKTEDYQAAVEHFERVLVTADQSLEQKASYNSGNAKYKFGIGYEESDLPNAIGLLEDSLRHYQRAIELDPEDADAKYNLEFVQKELQRLIQKQEQQQSGQQQDQSGQGQEQKDQNQQQNQQQQEQQEQQEQQQEQSQPEQQSAEDFESEQADESDQAESAQRPVQSKQMSEQEALMLLEGYSQEEESQGLYKEKMPAYGYPDVIKDW
ncbi:tetratricopeptide repeat protein [Candidatus Omnitrophota bacterium]